MENFVYPRKALNQWFTKSCFFDKKTQSDKFVILKNNNTLRFVQSDKMSSVIHYFASELTQNIFSKVDFLYTLTVN